MIRAFTSILWIIASLALGFEAMAQPCDMRAQMQASAEHHVMADMPCDDHMMMPISDEEDAPDHQKMACCCAALLGNGVMEHPVHITQPIPGITMWAAPLPVIALSHLPEFEPPPPRA
jgi:hypothetical protein